MRVKGFNEEEMKKMMGGIAITFKSYLERLREMEKVKPEEEQREVPTIRQIALSAGLHPVTASRLMHGHVKAVNLEKLALVIDDMRNRGFSTSISDCLTYSPS